MVSPDLLAQDGNEIRILFVGCILFFAALRFALAAAVDSVVCKAKLEGLGRILRGQSLEPELV